MANKVITISSNDKSSVTQSTEDLLIVYRDISHISEPSWYISSQKQQIDEAERTAPTSEARLISEINSADEFDYICAEYAGSTIASLLTVYFKRTHSKSEALALLKKSSQWNIARLINIRAIQNSLHNIFTWVPGERILNPEFGSKLRRLLYEGITEFNIEAIIAEIRGCISIWEPRVVVDKVINIGTVEDTEDNVVHLGIVYRIPGLSEEQYVYDMSQYMKV